MDPEEKLDKLNSLAEYRLSELLYELSRANVIHKYPDLQDAYTKYMDAVADLQRYCFAQVAAMNRSKR